MVTRLILGIYGRESKQVFLYARFWGHKRPRQSRPNFPATVIIISEPGWTLKVNLNPNHTRKMSDSRWPRFPHPPCSHQTTFCRRIALTTSDTAYHNSMSVPNCPKDQVITIRLVRNVRKKPSLALTALQIFRVLADRSALLLYTHHCTAETPT